MFNRLYQDDEVSEMPTFLTDTAFLQDVECGVGLDASLVVVNACMHAQRLSFLSTNRENGYEAY